MMQNFQPAIYLIKVCLGRFELESREKENGIGTFTFLSHAVNYCVGMEYHGKIRMANPLQHKIAQIDYSNLSFQT